MSFRLPKNLSTTLSFTSGVVKTGANVLESELAAEKAYSLGLASKAVETALVNLAAFEGANDSRANCVQVAADAVHRYFVQREMLGLTDHRAPTEFYNIPKEVLARVGAKGPV